MIMNTNSIPQLPDYPICFSPILGAAQLDVYSKCVFIDSKYENYPEYVIEWLYNHELGHILFDSPDSGRDINTEIACDQVALFKMAELGYTKTMILGAMDMALADSPEKTVRIEFLDKKY